MEKSFARIAGFEHESTLITGYDELVTCVKEGIELTPDATYTDTVLKLDTDNYGDVDGQEGFLDSIKRGSAKVYEWIKSIIKAIKEWLFGKPRREIQKVEKDIAVSSATLDKLLEPSAEVSTGPIEKTIEDSNISIDRRIKIIKILKRIRQEDRQVINETVVEPVINTDKSEQLITEMASRLTSRLESIKKNIEEIERVDPDRIVSKELGIDKFLMLYSKNGLEQSKTFLNVSNTMTIKIAAETIVKIAKEYDNALANATKQLEKMNSEGPFAVEDERSRQVSRAAKVVLELGNAANKMRDLVMTLDSQLLKTAAKMETAALTARLTEAMKHTTEASSNYLQMALDELKI